jgi:membrane protease subunit (stomatin/prohibitin family)
MLMNRFNVKNMMLTALGVIAFSATVPAQADGAGAFLGGIAVARIGGAIRRSNDAQQQQADAATAQAQAAQSQAAAPQTAEQKIAQLDKLAAGGYISTEEYKSRKKAILDNM